MAKVTNAFFDTSVLVAGMIDLGNSSESPMKVLDAIAEGQVDEPSTSWHNCLEFFSVTTRLPEEYRLAPETALRFVVEEIFTRFSVHQLDAEHRKNLLASAVAHGASGGRVYDAHIAAVARQAGAATVVTENRRHFLSLVDRGTQVLTAKDFLSSVQARPST